MREFLAEINGEKKKGQEVEKPDVAMANFRKILKEKQVKKIKRRKKIKKNGTLKFRDLFDKKYTRDNEKEWREFSKEKYPIEYKAQKEK